MSDREKMLLAVKAATDSDEFFEHLELLLEFKIPKII